MQDQPRLIVKVIDKFMSFDILMFVKQVKVIRKTIWQEEILGKFVVSIISGELSSNEKKSCLS